MAFTFETSGNNTFLVYGLEQEDTLDTVTLGMLANNRIRGMIPVLYTQMNRDCYLKYNVTARVTLRQFFSGTVNRRRLLGVFSGVTAALAAAEEYMIDCRSLLLDTDYIYVDVRSCDAEVVCLPLTRETEASDMSMFFKNIMFSTQFDQSENCDHVARIINYLNGSPVFVAEDFQKLVEELQTSPVPGGGQNVGSAAVQVQSVSTASQPVSMTSSSVSTAPQGNSAAPQAVSTASQAVSAASQSVAAVSSPVTPASRAVSTAAAQSTTPRSAGNAVASNTGFAVPKQKAEKRSASSQTPEKEISMLYLLQHYNKENAAAYKAQKDARKKNGKAPSAAGFAVPGQEQGIGQPPAQSQQRSVQPQQPSVQPQQLEPSSQAMPQKEPAAIYPQEDNFGDTVVMGVDEPGEDTVVMGESMAGVVIRPYLLRSSNNERIHIDKPVFHIGKERSYVDYCISGNATVSRSHADIISRNGQFFIVDNNSTNHTYVDGQMIPSNTETALSHGTKIRLSNEEFEFFTF